MNQCKALPSWLIQQSSLASSAVYFSPSFRSWALDHFGFPSPLHSAQFCHPAKETNQRALSQPPHFSFVSLSLSVPLSTCSSVCTLLSQHASLWPTRSMMSHQEQGLLGSDPGLNELVSSEHFCHCKMSILLFQESASLVWRKCLLFQELCPALLKSFKVAPWFPVFLRANFDAFVGATFHDRKLVICTNNWIKAFTSLTFN